MISPFLSLQVYLVPLISSFILHPSHWPFSFIINVFILTPELLQWLIPLCRMLYAIAFLVPSCSGLNFIVSSSEKTFPVAICKTVFLSHFQITSLFYFLHRIFHYLKYLLSLCVSIYILTRGKLSAGRGFLGLYC